MGPGLLFGLVEGLSQRLGPFDLLVQLVRLPHFEKAEEAREDQEKEDETNYDQFEQYHQLLCLGFVRVVLMDFSVLVRISEFAFVEEGKQ